MQEKSWETTLSQTQVILLAAVFGMAFTNVSFLRKLLEVYPAAPENLGFLLTVLLGFTGFSVVLMGLLCFRLTLKPILTLLLMISAVTAYFMDSYGVVIDETMLLNAIETNPGEAGDLMSLTLLGYMLFLGVIPSVFLWKTRIARRSRRRELWERVKLLGITLSLMTAMTLAFSDHYSSFFREHKEIRAYSNPGGTLYAAFKFAHHRLASADRPLQKIGLDAHIPEFDNHRELIILVVGETARADRFSLNGYQRETNPLLKKEKVISFTNFWSCGTSTAVSVPCMFSVYGERRYEDAHATDTENLLDVLKHAGVNLLWRDNNSSSKHVADRVEYQNYMTPEVNPVCDEECRDEGMLAGLQDYIDAHPKGDIAIILHQMGNHGPAYYKRYPKAFEKFTPVCRTNELADCTTQEIGNAYDNAILYTDYFLSKVIALLKKNDGPFETAMFYLSDHGESLGEKGMYLHGLPNFIAPEAQRHVPALLWVGNHFDEIDVEAIAKRRRKRYTQDSVFHTLLGFMEIESRVYKPRKDLLRH